MVDFALSSVARSVGVSRYTCYTMYRGMATINACIYKALLFGTPEQRVKAVNFDVCKSPEIN